VSNYVVTGANSEIGSALALHLIQNGHKLLLTSRSAKKGPLSGSCAWMEGVDLLRESDLLRIREEARRLFDSPFALVHSVGDFWRHKSIERTTLNEAVSMVQSHYITLFGVVKALVPVMREVGGGKVIAFSCNSVKYNYPDMSVFTSAKAAVECFIKCIANEQAQYDITANAFALPSIMTNSVIATKPEEYHKDYPTLDELVCCIEKVTESLTTLTNGNILSLFKYSSAFYHKGYYERNIIWEDAQDGEAAGIL